MKITYAIGEYSDNHDDIMIVLSPPPDPDDDDPGPALVHTWGMVGPGMPGSVYHGRDLCLGRVRAGTAASALEAWLREREDTLRVIASGYLGAERDGRGNLVGRWTDEASEAADVLARDIRGAWLFEYWRASDYLRPALSAREIAESVDLAGGWQAWGKSEAAEAPANGCHIWGGADALVEEGQAIVSEAIAEALDDHCDDCTVQLDEGRVLVEVGPGPLLILSAPKVQALLEGAPVYCEAYAQSDEAGTVDVGIGGRRISLARLASELGLAASWDV